MKSLNLTLLVDTEHHGVDRRLHVKAHDVANFFDELGIRRERETLAAMREQQPRGTFIVHQSFKH